MTLSSYFERARAKSAPIIHIFTEKLTVSVDWIASYLTSHSKTISWNSTVDLPSQFLNTIFLESRDCTYIKTV